MRVSRGGVRKKRRLFLYGSRPGLVQGDQGRRAGAQRGGRGPELRQRLYHVRVCPADRRRRRGGCPRASRRTAKRRRGRRAPGSRRTASGAPRRPNLDRFQGDRARVRVQGRARGQEPRERRREVRFAHPRVPVGFVRDHPGYALLPSGRGGVVQCQDDPKRQNRGTVQEIRQPGHRVHRGADEGDDAGAEPAGAVHAAGAAHELRPNLRPASRGLWRDRAGRSVRGQGQGHKPRAADANLRVLRPTGSRVRGAVSVRRSSRGGDDRG